MYDMILAYTFVQQNNTMHWKILQKLILVMRITKPFKSLYDFMNFFLSIVKQYLTNFKPT